MEEDQQRYPIRRFVDSDNSCLFNSIAYVCDRSNFNEMSALKMRQIIINEIRQNQLLNCKFYLNIFKLKLQNL